MLADTEQAAMVAAAGAVRAGGVEADTATRAPGGEVTDGSPQERKGEEETEAAGAAVVAGAAAAAGAGGPTSREAARPFQANSVQTWA